MKTDRVPTRTTTAGPDGRGGHLFSARRPLIAAAAGGAVAETLIVSAFGVRSALGFAVQVTAPPPFGVFHDVRWLLVYHRSWTAFVLQLLLLVMFRGTLSAVFVRLAWPQTHPRPPMRTVLPRTIGLTFLFVLVLSPWATFLFALAVTPVSWLFFVGLPTTLLLAFVVHHWMIARRWWQAWPPWRSLGWVALVFTVLTLAAVAMTTAPFPLAVAAAALTGLFNAWAWNGVVAAVATREAPRRHVPVGPLGAVMVIGFVVGGSVLGFQVFHASSEVRREAREARTDALEPVLVAGGFASSWDGNDGGPLGGGFAERRFSYAGTGPDGRPLAYGAADTQRSLDDLVGAMDRQVRALAESSGRDVPVVAESEGALIAKLYVTAHPDAPVERLVLLSPLIRPGRVYYPPPGENGWGVATGWQLRAMSMALRGLTPLELDPDSDLIRSVLENAPALWSVMDCPAPGIEEVVVFPLADAVVAPYLSSGEAEAFVIPAFHGGLLGQGNVRETAVLALKGREVPRPPALRVANLVIRGAASAWHVPMLGQTLNPVWDEVALVDGEDSPSCGAVRSLLTQRLTEAGDGR